MAMSPAVKELKRRLREEGASGLSVRRDTGAKGYDAIYIGRRGYSGLAREEILALKAVMGEYAQHLDPEKEGVGAGMSISYQTIEVEMALGMREAQPVCSCGNVYETEELVSSCIRAH